MHKETLSNEWKSAGKNNELKDQFPRWIEIIRRQAWPGGSDAAVTMLGPYGEAWVYTPGSPWLTGHVRTVIWADELQSGGLLGMRASLSLSLL